MTFLLRMNWAFSDAGGDEPRPLDRHAPAPRDPRACATPRGGKP